SAQELCMHGQWPQTISARVFQNAAISSSWLFSPPSSWPHFGDGSRSQQGGGRQAGPSGQYGAAVGQGAGASATWRGARFTFTSRQTWGTPSASRSRTIFVGWASFTVCTARTLLP